MLVLLGTVHHQSELGVACLKVRLAAGSLAIHDDMLSRLVGDVIGDTVHALPVALGAHAKVLGTAKVRAASNDARLTITLTISNFCREAFPCRILVAVLVKDIRRVTIQFVAC